MTHLAHIEGDEAVEARVGEAKPGRSKRQLHRTFFQRGQKVGVHLAPCHRVHVTSGKEEKERKKNLFSIQMIIARTERQAAIEIRGHGQCGLGGWGEWVGNG